MFFMNVQAQELSTELKTYYSHANNAHLAFSKGNYLASISELNLSFEKTEPKVQEVILLINTYAKLNKYDSSIKWISYGISKFSIPKYLFEKESYINKLDFDSLFKESYGNFYNSPSKVQSISMINHLALNDIFFHSQIHGIAENIDGKTISRLATKYDSAFAVPYLERLIKTYNFPDASDVGYSAEMAINAIMRHYHILKKELFDKALIDGKLTPIQYARITDYFFNWDFTQVVGQLSPKNNYGVNLNRLPDGTFLTADIDDIENLDKRREMIGLAPLWQQALVENFKLNDQYLEYLKRKGIKTN